MALHLPPGPRERPLRRLDLDAVKPSVTLKEIDEQRAKGWVDWGPEEYCHRSWMLVPHPLTPFRHIEREQTP